MKNRNLYLKTVSPEEALARYEKALEGLLSPKKELRRTMESLGYVTAEAIYAQCSSPLYNSAAMDGIAVRAARTQAASAEHPLVLTEGSDFRIVDTGDPVRTPFDAVIMAEDLVSVSPNRVMIAQSVPEWHHVRPVGEDVVEGELVLPSGHEVRGVDIGVLLASKNVAISVFSRPRVGIIPTGSELIAADAAPEIGAIIDSNSGMLSGLVRECRGVPTAYDSVVDDPGELKEAVCRALAEQDVVLLNAGSSAGTEDYSVEVLRSMGEVVVHGVAIKPGKPVILAVVQGKPVIGLPGYPVSAYIAFQQFVRPLLLRLAGNRSAQSDRLEAVLTRRIVSSLKHREYVRVKVGKVGDRYVAAPLSRGAGAAMSLVRADGFLVIDQHSEGLEAGSRVAIELLRPRRAIEGTLMSVGSHDMLMDLLDDLAAQKYPGMSISSSHVGSMGGLMALQRGETVLAPTHLLDGQTGRYNESILKKLFPPGEVSLIKGVDRIQGIMVKRGNPLDIRGVSDLVRGRFVNRQRGSGTRVLLDYLLQRQGICAEKIYGYEKEATTHMAVAAAVSGEDADCGVGIQSAAEAMGLDFIPVGKEEYDFAVRTVDLAHPSVAAFRSLLCSAEFRCALEQRGGYGFSHTGEVRTIR